MAVKSLWSASFLKYPPYRRGASARTRPLSIDVRVLGNSASTAVI